MGPSLSQLGREIPSDDLLCSETGWQIEPKECKYQGDLQAGQSCGAQGRKTPMTTRKVESRMTIQKKSRQEGLQKSCSETQLLADSLPTSKDGSSIHNDDHLKPITNQGSVELPKNTKRREAGTEAQSQPKKKRLNKVTPRHCLYCDETLSRKQAWDNHMKRKHSKAPYVQFKDLNQVQAAQECGHNSRSTACLPPSCSCRVSIFLAKCRCATAA